MYANGNESPTLWTYVSDETKVSFLNVSTFKSAQVPWTYFSESQMVISITRRKMTQKDTIYGILIEHVSSRAFGL